MVEKDGVTIAGMAIPLGISIMAIALVSLKDTLPGIIFMSLGAFMALVGIFVLLAALKLAKQKEKQEEEKHVAFLTLIGIITSDIRGMRGDLKELGEILKEDRKNDRNKNNPA